MNDNEKVFAYERIFDDQKISVYCNFSDEEIELDVNDKNKAIIRIDTSIKNGNYTLKPYGALVIQN